MEVDNYFFPGEENLGKNCMFWGLKVVGGIAVGCAYPKAELEGRMSCDGIVDDVCLFIKDGRQPSSLTEQQRTELITRIPNLTDKSYIPPGNTE